MKKKVLIVLALVMLIMSVSVVASADDSMQAVTYMATAAQRSGVSKDTNMQFELGYITPGKYLITATMASQDESVTPFAKGELWITPAKYAFGNASYKVTGINVPTKGWTTFSQVILGIHDFTANDQFLYVVSRNNLLRLASVTLTPMPEATLTYSQANDADKIQVSGNGTQTMDQGMSKNSAAWIQTDAPNGTYALLANVAANTENAKVTCYLNSALNENYLKVSDNVTVPYANSWTTFSDMHVGFVNITDTHKMVCLSATTDIMRIKSITLVPVDNVVPTTSVIQDDAKVSFVKPGKVTMRANVNKVLDNKAYTFIAAYYEEGELVAIKPAKATSYDGEWNATFDEVKAGGNNYVRFFVWDNSTVRPATKDISAPIMPIE